MRCFFIICFSLFFVTCRAQERSLFQVEKLGSPLSATMIQGSLFVKDQQDNKWIYTVARGEPAHLLGYNLATGKLEVEQALEGTDGAWDLVYNTDGYLYIPGAKGSLFRYHPEHRKVESLGQVLPGETYVWNLAVGKDGEIFGATYPGCRVFRYHPADGFSDAGRGALVEGENYVRSLVYHEEQDILYAGVGSHADLLVLNPRTGEKRHLLPEKYKHKEFVYGLEIVPHVDGDRLFVLLTSGRETLVYNIRTQQFEQEIAGMDMKALAYTGQKVYYTAKNTLMSFDPQHAVSTADELLGHVGSANAITVWDDDVFLLNSAGEIYIYTLENQTVKHLSLDIPRQPIPINALMYGPDKKIWMGGYLAGGHATYDPVTGAMQEFLGLDQTEGMAVAGQDIYFGIYPKGRFYRYDTGSDWDLAGGNPHKIGEVEGQSRSFALLKIPNQDKMYFGMIPEYGQLGGTLVAYDIKKDVLTSWDSVVSEQALASLVHTQGQLVGGTTISGGLGAKPIAREAVLFGWDIQADTLLYRTVPIAGAPAITCLIEGPDGYVWGIAGGQLFVFDMEKRKVLETYHMYDPPAMGTHVWRSAFMAVHPDGNVYGTVNNSLFKIEAKTKKITFIHQGASLFAMDSAGNIYFRKNTELWRYKPD